MLFYINEIEPELKSLFIKESYESPICKAYRKEQEVFQSNLIRTAVQSEEMVYQAMDKVRQVMKETFADLGAIYLLDLEPVDYLEAYLLSESYIPEGDTINNTLLNRVALVNSVLSEDENWKQQWTKLGKNSVPINEYLLQLKEKTDQYSLQENRINMERDRDDEFNPFLFKEVFDYEKEYLIHCKEALVEQIKEKELEKKILKEVYKHFSIINADGESFTFKEFFYDFGRLVNNYKKYMRKNGRKVLPQKTKKIYTLHKKLIKNRLSYILKKGQMLRR